MKKSLEKHFLQSENLIGKNRGIGGGPPLMRHYSAIFCRSQGFRPFEAYFIFGTCPALRSGVLFLIWWLYTPPVIESILDPNGSNPCY